MARFLANENVPADAVEAARQSGIDMAWVKEILPGATDIDVLARAVSEDRVLVTFDKDFGEMVFHLGRTANPGIVLLRPKLRSPSFVAHFTVSVLTQSVEWAGHLSVAQEGRLRVVPLPG